MVNVPELTRPPAVVNAAPLRSRNAPSLFARDPSAENEALLPFRITVDALVVIGFSPAIVLLLSTS